MNATERKILDFWKFKENFTKIIKTKPSHYLTIDNNQLKKEHPQLISDFRRYYKDIMGVDLTVTGCGNCLIDEFIKIKAFSLTQIIAKMTLIHKLKKDKVVNGIDIGLDNVYYCSESQHLTNDVCEKIHEKYGDAWFDLYVANWRDLVVSVDAVSIQRTIDNGTFQEFFDMELGDAQEFTVEVNEAEIETEASRSEDITNFDTMSYNDLRRYARDNGIKLTATKTSDIRNELKAL